MKVVFFHRKRSEGTFSLEGYFQTLRDFMPAEIDCVVAESTFESRGVIKRFYNTIEAIFRQGDVNHITGDVHFISYFLKKRKTLLTILDCVFTYNTTGIIKHILRYFWYIIPEKRVSIITVISQSTKTEVLKVISCNPNKIVVIPVCISPSFCYNERVFNADKPVILQIGTAKNKNLLRLFKALQGISCKLDLVGKLTEEHKKALDYFRIEYSNALDLTESEIIRKYQECDLVTLISTYEGFGMPILEANAVGRVIITSNVFSMPEVAGDAACIVDPYNIEQIRAGILRIIREDKYRKELINSGVLNVHRFNAENIAKQYIYLYNKLAKGC